MATTELFDSYEAVGIKEDISDLIHNISPTETPFISAIPTTTATQRVHQWQTDSLATPASNTNVEGEDASLAAQTPTTLLGNYTQISIQVFGVTGTMEQTSTGVITMSPRLTWVEPSSLGSML